MTNKMSIKFSALSINESFARTVIASFALILSPTIEQLSDLKTVTSEAVTNCIVHAYREGTGDIVMNAQIAENEIFVQILDEGVGIEDIDRALQMMFTTRADEERSGMGFTIMQAFADNLKVEHNYPCGTKVSFSKKMGNLTRKINARGGEELA